MIDSEYNALLNQELERLHALVSQGKEVSWATEQIQWLTRAAFTPIYIPTAEQARK